MARRYTTVKDIAEAAGVSATTVSYVLNQNPSQSISAKTTQKVLEAARLLNYIPHNAARIMRNDKSCCVGIVMNRSFRIQRFSDVAAGITDVLNRQDYRMLLCGGKQKGSLYAAYLEDYFRYQLDGLIFICDQNEGPDIEDEEVIVKNRIPMVVFDSLEQKRPFGTVDFDYYEGTRRIVESLIGPATRHLLYLRPSYDNRQEILREQAVRDVLSVHPQLSLEIMKETPSDKMQAEADRKGERAVYFDVFIQAGLRERLKKMGEEDIVFSDWALWLPYVKDEMERLEVRFRLGSPAQAMEAGWGNLKLAFGDYQNFRAGQECAALLMEMIEPGAERKAGVRHKTLPIRVITKNI